MARKGSRSYNDPAYREKVLRLAPEDAYRRAVKDVNHRVVQYVQQAYQSDHTFLTNQASIDRLTAIMAPAVEAGQLQIADLTNAHLSTLFGVKHPPAPDLSTFERPNISRVRELARPFWTAIKAAEKGKDFDAALAAGEARLTKMVETDLQMAKVRQAREVLKAGGIRRYARVTGGNACWLCEIAATQVYYTEDLLPIHPSCVVSGTLVAVPTDQAGSAGLLGAIEAATRQKFVGEIIELSTASGNLVRVTPNHPVLTDKGWIPAGLIRKGDNVFRSLRGERPVDGRPDVAQRPSRIEDVFAAASVTGRLLRVPTTAEDFHGDGSDHEVDVVWTASDLAPPFDVLGVQQAGELCLMHAHGSRVPLVGQGAFEGLAGLRFSASRSMIRSGGDRGTLLDGGAFVTQQAGFSRPARFNPTAAQFAGDGVAAYADQGRALQHRLAGKIERDSVIECRRVSFAGHVFNLQTAEGWYVADNIILSNCNCSVQPIPEGGEAEIRQGFTPEEILKHSDEQVRRMLGLVEDGAPLSDYQDLVAVREHGEIGPMLTWKHQSFTGPQDLPVPPSREVLEQQAFDAVKQSGGVTINLAGQSPHNGYAYAPFKGTEMVVPQGEFTPDDIDRYIDAHAAQLAQKGNHLGMWTQDGNVYLDVSRVGAPTVETLSKAQGAHQLAVYDLSNGHDINLGRIDSAGRYTAAGTPADLLDGYREQIARADEARGAGRVPELVDQQRRLTTSLTLPDEMSGVRKATRTAAQTNKDATTKLRDELTARHDGLNLVMFGDAKPVQAQSISRAVDDVLAKHPEIKLKGIQVGETYNRSAYAETSRMIDATPRRIAGKTFTLPASKDVPQSWSTIVVNGNQIKNQTALERDYFAHVDGKLFAKGSGDPLYDITVHELGHALDNAGGRFARSEAENYLLSAYRGMGHPDVVSGRDEGFRKWLTDNMPMYSFRLKRPPGEIMPQILANAPLNPAEAVAEAFKDVFINGDKASSTSKVLYKLLTESATEAQLPVARGVKKVAVSGRLGKPRGIKGRLDKIAPAMSTPAKVVAAKEKTRGEKYLAKYQRQATKVAKEAERAAGRQAKAAAARIGTGGPFTPPHILKPIMVPAKGSDFLSTRKMADNILARWNDTTGENAWIREAGRQWYPSARQWMRKLMADSGVGWTENQAAAVVAAFSGNTAWPRNMMDASNFFKGFPVHTLSNNIKAARRALGADDPIASLGGNKWINFARSIVGDPDAVAVDRWAARVALGTDDKDLAGLVLGRKDAYERIAEAYRIAAKEAGVMPSEIQAAVWVHVIPPDADIKAFAEAGRWA